MCWISTRVSRVRPFVITLVGWSFIQLNIMRHFLDAAAAAAADADGGMGGVLSEKQVLKEDVIYSRRSKRS